MTSTGETKRLNAFERYLSAWVALCIVAGVAIGLVAPGLVGALSRLEVRHVNLPIAILIWLMIYPMMLRIDFAALRGVGRRGGPLRGGQPFHRMVAALREQLATLDAEQAKGRTILDGMVEGVVALDARGRLLLVNPAARTILEIGADRVEGRPLLEVVRQKELADLAKTTRRLLEGRP